MMVSMILPSFVGAMLAKANNDDAGFTAKVEQRREDTITNWMVDKSTLYATAAELLRDHPNPYHIIPMQGGNC